MARVKQMSPLQKRKAARATRGRYASPYVVVPRCSIRWSDYMYTASSASPHPQPRLRESSAESEYRPTTYHMNKHPPISSFHSSDSDFSPRHSTRAVLLSQDTTASIMITSEQLSMKKKKSTNHQWTFVERQSLCILRRNFTVGYKDIVQLLNFLFPCPQQPFLLNMIKQQFNSMKLGHRGMPAYIKPYASVWMQDFERFQGQFAYRIAQLQVKGESIGLEMWPREFDDAGELRAAIRFRVQQSNWLQSRLLCSALEESGEERESTPESLAGDDEPLVKREETVLSGATPDAVMLDSEQGSEVTNSTTLTQQDIIEQNQTNFTVSESSTVSPPSESKNIPALLFRYVGQRTAGLNSDTIRAGRYSTLLHCPVPPAPDSRSDTFLFDAELHFSRHEMGLGSPLISTSYSLLWNIAMCCGNNNEDSSGRIYVVDGQAAHKHSRVYPAAAIISELRKRGRFRADSIRRAGDNSSSLSKTHYKGCYEMLVHAEISKDSILGVVPVAKIKELADAHESIKQFLRLEYFQSTRNTTMIYKRMAKDKMKFDAITGDAIARLMVLFGANRETDAALSGTLFKQFYDGWCLQMPQSNAALEIAASSFASTFVAITDDSSNPVVTYHKMVNLVKQAK